MPLETIPVEIIELIGENIVPTADLNSLSRTSRRLHQILDPCLYAHDARQDRKALIWSINQVSLPLLEKTLRHGVNVNNKYKGPWHIRPLAQAARMHNLEIVKLLLEHGADPNPPGWRPIQRTPLSAAAKSGSYDIAKILIEAGADVHAAIFARWGPLCLYMATGPGKNVDLVRLLLEKGALDGMPDEHKGILALEHAIQFGNISIVRLLLQAGANPVFRDAEGRTPLMLALEAKSEDMAFLFLEIGGDLDHTDNEGRGLVWYAARHNCENVVRYLSERGCSTNDDRWPTPAAAVSGKNVTILELLLNAGARIEQQDQDERTPLRVAFEYEDQDMMELLMKRGASLKGAGLDESLVSRPVLGR